MEVRDLSFAYDEEPVLHDVSLRIRSGETLAVMGSNGSGKTTLLRLLAGLREPRSGTVEFEGVVGFAPEDPRAALFESTVKKEVAFFPRNRGLDPEQATERALREMGVFDLRDRNPLSLSYGEQRRVSIAAVLAGDPNVVALDEPTSGIGTVSERQLGTALSELDATVVVSTHSSDFAYEHADRVAVLDDGRLRELGESRGVLDRVDLLEKVGIRPPGAVVWARNRGLSRPPASLEDAVAAAREGR